ncbi:DUF2157 domain-containing protein [Tahibacter amnicola]|uniref:DUF2157 domain-containing protein n=1 Tax=Tahibacter amnicola TaxID=2976241 RepID=A0ABY6BL09_9GAMM|nr:DUF2157 domain-containing protein [Tahibacter amnicola]UXI70108.1 DUF2157 domain-containing protein [Tahibacter amnicola]
MSTLGHWLDQNRQRHRLARWQRDGVLRSADAAATALGIDPTPPWAWFLDRLGLWGGVSLIGTGVISFIAANWDALGVMARLGGIQLLLVGTVGAAWYFRGKARVFEAGLFLAMMIVGAFLGLIGQTYRIEADAWHLFAAWTALSLPWVVASRSAVLWLAAIALANLTFALWLRDNSLRYIPANDLVNLSVFNTALFIAWVAAALRLPELRGRQGPLILAFTALAFVSAAAVRDVAGDRGAAVGSVGFWLVLMIGFGIYFARNRPRNLLGLSGLALSALVVANVVLGRILLELLRDAIWVLLMLAVAIVGQLVGVVVILRRLARSEAS